MLCGLITLTTISIASVVVNVFVNVASGKGKLILIAYDLIKPWKVQSIDLHTVQNYRRHIIACISYLNSNQYSSRYDIHIVAYLYFVLVFSFSGASVLAVMLMTRGAKKS